MAIVKRTTADYNLTAIDSNVNVTALSVNISGNLIVSGSSSQVGSINTFIYDNFVTLAAGQVGAPIVDAGIEVYRGSEPTVGIRWHEPDLEWQYTEDGTNWFPFKFRLINDTDPHLGGNLIVNGWYITSEPGEDVQIIAGDGGSLILGPIIRIPHIDFDAAPLTGHSSIYAKPTQSGDVGIYVSNEKRVADELITRRKALIYSILM